MIKNLLLSILLISLLSCTQESKPPVNTDPSDEITGGLLPSIILKGDSASTMDLADRMNHHNVPGVSIAFFENGEIVWAKGYGHLSFDSLQAVNPETRFQAASISKPVAATGLLTLVETGQFDLDENVNEYLSDWQVPENNFTINEKVTLRKILSHTAGLTVHGFRGYASDEDVPTTLQVLKGESPANSAAILPDVIPGTIWRYSGGGYTLMQYTVEQTTGESFPEFMQETVLTPLNMTRSTYQQPLPQDMRDNVAIGYRGNGEKVTGNWHTYPEIAAAGLWTTPTDLAKWAISIQNSFNGKGNKVLSNTMTKEMLTEVKGEYGMGPGVAGKGDTLVFSHGGANEGYRCLLIAYGKDGGQGAIIMTNGDRGSPLASEIFRSISSYYNWHIFKSEERNVLPLSPSQKEEYVGIYRTTDGFEVEINLVDDALIATVKTPNPFSFTMVPEKEDIFFDQSDGTTLTFNRDDTGAITSFNADGYEFLVVPNPSS